MSNSSFFCGRSNLKKREIVLSVSSPFSNRSEGTRRIKTPVHCLKKSSGVYFTIPFAGSATTTCFLEILCITT